VVVDPTWADQIQLRPSIETIFHALMPQVVVVHLHSVTLLSKLIMRDCETELATLLQDRRHALVPYRKPGVNLAESVKEVLEHRPDVDVLLLANHGIVVAAETVEALAERLEELLSSLPAPERQRSAERGIAAPPTGFRPVANERIHDLAFDERAFNIAKCAWAITPDHVVFLGPDCNTFSSADEFERSPLQPSFAIIRGSGVYLNILEMRSSSLIEEMLVFFRDVTMRVANPKDVRTLSHAEVTDLLGWEAEKYRQTLNSVGPR
jgi:rhamnose utilization protein RhaD (predicted bifunctional aldolase and dehydrogenase)